MSEFIRVSRRILTSLHRAPRHAVDAVKAVRIFSAPGRFLVAYAVGRSLDGAVVRLRDGFEIETSNSASDPSTIMVVLVREDYAPIPRGGVVIDVGANIGTFMLYAIRSGAKRVVAFEPSRDAFSVLRRNVERNRLHEHVVVRQLAVAGRSGATVWFPTASNPTNHMLDGRSSTDPALHRDHAPVTTTSVAEIVDTYGDVDLLKLDCEGAEYEIVASTHGSAWSRIRAVRIEYHKGRAAELIAPLLGCGFRLTRTTPDPLWPDDMGMLHFERD